MKTQPDIYLASASPRRQELLDQIGVCFTVLQVEVDEQHLSGESPADYVTRLALVKARAGRALLDAEDTCPVLGADTTVVTDDVIMGKPESEAEARAHFEELGYQVHSISAVTKAGTRELINLIGSELASLRDNRNNSDENELS